MMKCAFCFKDAEKVNVREDRHGAGADHEKTYVCKSHASQAHDHAGTVNLIRRQEYGPVNPTGDDPS